MSFKFGMYKYALFCRPESAESAIQRKYADRSVLAQSWQKCARAYPGHWVILFSRLSNKEKCWFNKEENLMSDEEDERDHADSDLVLERIAKAVDGTIERDMELREVSIVFANGQGITAKGSTLLLQKMALMLAVLLKMDDGDGL